MAENFQGTVQQVHVLRGDRVLILGEYQGDIEVGEKIFIEQPTGGYEVTVKNLAWGSAFDAKSPPLTLVVELLDRPIAAGSRLRGTE